MSTMIFAFAVFVIVMLGMAVGVIFSGRRIQGSCGGLNAIEGTDRCVICKREVDPDSPLRERMSCPRKRNSADAAERAP